jgi:hypothetical protein
MNENNIKEFSDFVSNLNFTYTHSGGIDLLDDANSIAQRMIDFDIYDVQGYASVKHFCNNLSLPEFEKRLKVYTRNIDDAVTENIKDLPTTIASISNLRKDIFNYENKYDGNIIYTAPEKKVGKGHVDTIEYDSVFDEEIIEFYQSEVYVELKKLIGKNDKFTLDKVKINYQIDYPKDKYIQYIKYFIDTLLNSLENKKYLYTNEPSPVSRYEKIKWNKTSTMMGYLFYLLHDESIIELPSDSNGNLKSTETAKWLVDNFTFPKEKNNTVKIDSLRKRLNEHNALTMNPDDKQYIDTLLEKIESLVSRIDKLIE